MEWLFGKRKTPEEMMRQNQRALNKAMRDLDRERSKMEMQEKKLISDIKKMAKDNQMDAVKIMAKDLVRTRRYVKKFIMMRANIQAVSLKIQTLRSQNAMAQAMRGVTKAMQSMNRQMNLPQIQRIMQDFEKQSDMMDMKEEMMSDVIDDVIGDEEDEEESDAVVSQILDELGVQLNQKLSDLPTANSTLNSEKAKSKQGPVAIGAGGVGIGGAPGGGGAGVGGGGGAPLDDADADLQARLENLRRG
ncbi:vacuolar protein sorting 2 [Dermatophagoides pteronyssinus]|uniref:Charged multivesicular body protein 2A n=2 Tax=Dermatophagoides pteronyssinus TaxID=6956 RepID=A0ABQ8JRB7_DERPT|nr:charged multivesicular body protein 2a-like [Dermatophagoides pteronyssinus]KAH9424980.1 Charged multivesicular body protein 2A [Dermatophagoides pteronyssinus]